MAGLDSTDFFRFIERLLKKALKHPKADEQLRFEFEAKMKKYQSFVSWFYGLLLNRFNEALKEYDGIESLRK